MQVIHYIVQLTAQAGKIYSSVTCR